MAIPISPAAQVTIPVTSLSLPIFPEELNLKTQIFLVKVIWMPFLDACFGWGRNLDAMFLAAGPDGRDKLHRL